MGKFIDLTGQRFGRLIVIERAEGHIQPNGRLVTQWLCKCDCGGENSFKVIQAKNLTGGLTQSCGCLGKERRYEAIKKFNTYDLSGEYGIGYTSKGEEFYFDLEDYNKIKKYCWYKDSNGYIVAYLDYQCIILMHRLIMNPPEDMEIDHIYHINYDNRKSELRIVTTSQNMMNQKIRQDNSSGFKGVYWNKENKKWYVQIRVKDKNEYLGQYADINEALKVRQDAEELYYGEYKYKERQQK